MQGPVMRPMSVGELLDQVFTTYRSHFALFVGIMLLPAIVTATTAMAIFILQPDFAMEEGADPAVALPNMVIFLLGVIILWVIQVVVNAVGMAATTIALADVHLGRAVTILGTYSGMGRWFFQVVGLSFVIILLLMVAAMVASIVAILPAAAVAAMIHPVLAIIVGIPLGIGAFLGVAFLLVRFGVAVPVLILERTGIFDSMRRSTSLTAGFRFRVILLYLLMLVISYVAALIFQGPFFAAAMMLAEGGSPPFWTEAGQALGGGISTALSGPLLSIGMALLYFDLKVRKEALDLEMAMQGMAPAPAGPPAG